MQAKRTLGLSIAAEKYGSRLFSNSAIPSVVLTTENKVKPEDRMKMRQDWEVLQGGKNQHRLAVLDQGLKVEKLSVTNEEAQFLELRQFTRAEIASLFRIPVHMVGELQKLSNSNTENMNLSFVVDTLRPYISRIEAEVTKKLLPREAGKPSSLQVQFDTSERLRGDTVAQTAGAATGRQWGWLTANDVRRSMGLNEGGPELDVYINPVNMENSRRLLDVPTPEKETVPNV
jgi:HK97 family phage portal protein